MEILILKRSSIGFLDKLKLRLLRQGRDGIKKEDSKREEKMPIYEFRCMNCGMVFEKLFISKDEKVELNCPQCKSESIERVVSRTNYIMGLPADQKKPKLTQRSCAGGSCYTLDLPGPTKD